MAIHHEYHSEQIDSKSNDVEMVCARVSLHNCNNLILISSFSPTNNNTDHIDRLASAIECITSTNNKSEARIGWDYNLPDQLNRYLVKINGKFLKC